MGNIKRLLYRILALASGPDFPGLLRGTDHKPGPTPDRLWRVDVFGAFPGGWRGESIQGFAARLKAAGWRSP
jgi:hypothetical protein